MGLDMYLKKAPRFEDCTMTDISAISSYLRLKKCKAEGRIGKSRTLKEWCGIDYKDLPRRRAIEFYKNHATNDEYCSIATEVAYWRKANQIHNWFVKHVQDGEDDCCYHNEVTKEILEELLETCEKVALNSKLVSGKIVNGLRYVNGNEEPIYEEGKTIEDPYTAQMLLPTSGGFFFGGTNYDQYYIEDLKCTIDQIEQILEETDFEKEMVYYVSSW